VNSDGQKSLQRNLPNRTKRMNLGSSKVALVTGAGTGIGRAVSLMLASQGYSVVLAGRRAQPLKQVSEEITQLGQRALAVITDVSDRDATQALFDRIRTEFGRLDLLFNNAGINTRAAPLEDLKPAEWRSVIDINLTGAFFCIQEAFRIMKSQNPKGGRIINNGSVSATTPRPNSVAYTASKHAVTGLTRAAALEGRRYDIACGQIDIGNAATSIGEDAAKGALQADGSTADEPMFETALVAEAVKYMASLPLEANVLSLTVMATQMPFVGRG
jgi:NAD(P)-dependent dehydrogenase (short-subunit alcohol dehydrogenase family)